MRRRPRCIDAEDARMRVRRAQQLAIRYSGERNVIREARLPGDFGARVYSPARHADYAQLFCFVSFFLGGNNRRFFDLWHVSSRSSGDALHKFCRDAVFEKFYIRDSVFFAEAIFKTADSTASKICRYPVRSEEHTSELQS